MNVYFSAPFSWRESLKPKRDELVGAGIEVVSSWIDIGHTPLSDAALDRSAGALAEYDLRDINACDVFVAFIPPAGHHYNSGGRHVEYGYALAMNKIVMRVGPRENIFYELAGYSCNSWQIASEVLQVWAKHPETRPAPWVP